MLSSPWATNAVSLGGAIERSRETGTRLTVVTGESESLRELVLSARAGDRVAFDGLYKRFAAAIHAVALAHAPAADAHDVVQDSFVRAWAHLRELREPEAFAGWIIGIARRRAVDVRRSEKRRGGPALELGDDTVTASPVPAGEAKEALAAISALAETYRETLMMRLVEGMSGPEIAEVTGMTPESVRVNLCRGMKLLRERLEKGAPR
jgi:RNA polymerase sigma-70 factor (ECF subfamily)